MDTQLDELTGTSLSPKLVLGCIIALVIIVIFAMYVFGDRKKKQKGSLSGEEADEMDEEIDDLIDFIHEKQESA